MPNPFPHLHQKLRELVCAIVGVFLIIISLVIILTQFTELSAKNENLSLASFLVILSFRGVARKWSGIRSRAGSTSAY
jgi:divalent metal cation (Fe/Co/Zn/Cd) transporter